MARYFFHFHECGTSFEDEEGAELPDIDSVRRAALKHVRGVMCGEVEEGRLCLSCHIEVTDADGRAVMTIPFRDALVITGM